MDEYIVKKCSNGEGKFFYYKNGKLHREAGPAVVIVPKKEEFTNLGDEHLYKEEIIAEHNPKDYQTLFIESVEKNATVTVAAYHYLEGKPYTEEEFQIIKAKNELDKELPTDLNNHKNKKPKL